MEQGSYGNYSYAFSNVVFQSGGSSADCLSANSTDTFSGSLTTTGSFSGQQSGSDDVGLSDGDDDGQSSNSGSETETESINSRDTLTGGDSAVWSEYESGGYSGGSYAFSSLNYQDSGSDSTTDTSLGTSYGTFAGSGSESQTLSGAVGGTFTDDFSASSAGSATGSSSGTDTGSSDMTAQSGDCWSLTELGSYSNGSYSLSSYVSSSSDSNSIGAQDTDSVSETVTATGSQSDDSAETNAATVQGTWTSSGSPSSGTFVVTLDDGEGGDEDGSFTETTTLTDTTTATDLETFSESDYQAGVYSAGSFNLSCVVYSLSSSGSSSDSVTDSSNGTNVSLDTSQDNASSGGDQDGFSDNDGYAVASNDTANGHETMSGGDTATAQSQFTESLYQAGNFSNDSYSLSSYAFSEQGSDTITSSSSDTYTTLDTGTASGQETILDVEMYNGSDTFTETITGGDGSAATQNDSWSLTELGSMSAGVMALSCYALSEQENNSSSSSDSSSWSETFTGANGRFGFSGGDSGSGSDNQSSSASGTLLEVGTATGDVLTLSLVSYSGSGSESGSASDGDGGSWSGQSYSGKDSDSAQSGDSGSYSVSALGSYSNGSWSLSSYVLDGSSTDWATQSASEQDTFSYGTGCLGSGNQYYSRSDTTGSQESDSVYQTGVETAGVYANVSYNGTDDSVASATQDTSSPYLSSIDTWQTSETQTELLTGGSATSSSSFGFRDTNYSGSGVGSVQESLTLTAPGVLVDLLLPDASSVPVVGADELSGGMPVSTPNVGVVAATAEWLAGTGASAQEETQPDSAMPMVPPGAVGGPTQTPAAAVKQVVNGAGLTPAGNGPTIQNVSYQAQSPPQDKKEQSAPQDKKKAQNQLPKAIQQRYDALIELPKTFVPAGGIPPPTPSIAQSKKAVNDRFQKAINIASKGGNEALQKNLDKAKKQFNEASDKISKALEDRRAKEITDTLAKWKATLEAAKMKAKIQRELKFEDVPTDEDLDRIFREEETKMINKINRKYDQFWAKKLGPALETFYFSRGIDRNPFAEAGKEGSEARATFAIVFSNREGDLDIKVAIQLAGGTSVKEFLELVEQSIIKPTEKPSGVRIPEP